jgi:hypothetical protein
MKYFLNDNLLFYYQLHLKSSVYELKYYKFKYNLNIYYK